jgi:septal ring factor EnvC (AmiA/AmiB activator)
MTRADNSRFLAQAAASLHQAMLSRTSDAIENLNNSGQPVSFCSVAIAADVSRSWLYRQPDIRDLISRLRSTPSRSASTQAAQRATAESLRARLHAARAEITRLRADNTKLRDQIARQFGEQRTQIHPADPAIRPEPHASDMSTAQNRPSTSAYPKTT